MSSTVWVEFTNPDGKKYYFNNATKQSVWEKPEELMTPAERAAARSSWKEYTAEGGRIYWHNIVTKESVWEIPTDLKTAIDEANATAAAPPTAKPTEVPAAIAPSPVIPAQFTPAAGMHPSRSAHLVQSEAPDANHKLLLEPSVKYDDEQEAKEAFFETLKNAGVKSDWTWEQAIKATCKEPDFMALETPSARKDAFLQYIKQEKEREAQESGEKRAVFINEFKDLLQSTPEIKYYTRWRTAKSILSSEVIFYASKNEKLKHRIFKWYIGNLRQEKRKEDSKALHKAQQDLSKLLDDFHLDPYAKWGDTLERIENDDEFAKNSEYKVLSKLDILVLFESHVKSLEREFAATQQRNKELRMRRGQKYRQQFRNLLLELKDKDLIKAHTFWVDIFPLIKDDERFINLCGEQGSSPLDLFFDIVEKEDQHLLDQRERVADIVYDKKFQVTESTTLEELIELVRHYDKDIDEEAISAELDRLHAKAKRRAEEDRLQEERKIRRKVDNLRHYIKYLEPPVLLDDVWDNVKVRIESSPEYLALETDEQRKLAFDKHQRRLKEKREYDAEHGLPPLRRGESDRRRASMRNGSSQRNNRQGPATTSVVSKTAGSPPPDRHVDQLSASRKRIRYDFDEPVPARRPRNTKDESKQSDSKLQHDDSTKQV